jgi:hypothetical protein
MKYTLVMIGKEDQELLDRGLPHEKFLLGPKYSSAPLELASFEPLLDHQRCIARLELVHIHAARDHLVLTSPTLLDITPTESEALYAAVKDILAELSSTIYRTDSLPGRWFIEAEKLKSLSTVHTAQAEGRNIDIWMPIDTDIPGIARQWRKWQNEIQMIWFDHPVNQARAANGQLSINSIWISGIGCLADLQPHQALHAAQRLHSPDNTLAFLAKHLKKNHVRHLDSQAFQNALSLLMQENPTSTQIWHDAIEALRAQTITSIELIDFPQGVLRTQQLTHKDLPKKGWAFWKKPSTPSLEDILGSS